MAALPPPPPTTRARTIARYVLAAQMVFAGFSHLFWARQEFQAQVPQWVPMDADGVVMASGGVEIALGVGLAVLRRDRVLVGGLLAVFFVLIFPGNLAQYLNHVDAFNLNSDISRLVRLFFQPVLIAWVLWATAIPKSKQVPQSA
ncbi:hypothetical protein MU0083_000787 [[Mycobacterium] kokjensenii]|uniref:DoxX family membrane protein n=1 Tax=[Mycobacterium] kokjensenii TaxID=3064287 RepID=A0ABN9MVS1_9MYCO|nr:hypothetical protein [Mycolicibacter sp. MU0083]CAJ1494377.1 hypothetical protein MU0083_000787 [Mycolicibacter sp. MU0083]